jgi:hypothetical protein
MSASTPSTTRLTVASPPKTVLARSLTLPRPLHYCAIADQLGVVECVSAIAPAGYVTAPVFLPWSTLAWIERLRPMYRFLEDPLKAVAGMNRAWQFAFCTVLTLFGLVMIAAVLL